VNHLHLSKYLFIDFDPDNTNQVPRVTAPRLTVHLTLALILYSSLLWQGLKLRGIGALTSSVAPALRRWSLFNVAMVGITAMTGALVAGRDAGLIYKTFPTMDGDWIPPDLLKLQPTIRNFLENDATIQFTHRVMVLYIFS
jgi:cytochrome c oxidase assembly protein subunit 15